MSAFLLLVISALAVSSLEERQGFAKIYDLEDGTLIQCESGHGLDAYQAALSPNVFSELDTLPEKLEEGCGKTAKVTNPTNGASILVEFWHFCDDCPINDILLSEEGFEALGENSSVQSFEINWEIEAEPLEVVDFDFGENGLEELSAEIEVEEEQEAETSFFNYVITFVISGIQSITVFN